MTYEIYFPEHRHLLNVSLIQRDRLLPDDVDGHPEKGRNNRVGFRDVVARGMRPAPYIVIDAMRELKLRRPDKLPSLMLVEEGQEIVRGQVIAGKTKRNGDPVKGKSIVAPHGGTVIYVGQGRIIIQETPEEVTVESGVNGTVITLQGNRGVTVETYAAVLQGAWGNGKRAIGVLKGEPDDGLESIYGDAMDNHYRGAIMYTRRPLRAMMLEVITDQGLAGLIAPSLEPQLLGAALNVNAPILLTEGFGTARMNTTYFQFLEEMEGKQVMLDALRPSTVNTTRPEAIITVPLNANERPSSPSTRIALRAGLEVGIVTGQGDTVTGRVTDLPNEPVLLDNGLRVPCALVELSTGEVRHVPLANIELYG